MKIYALLTLDNEPVTGKLIKQWEEEAGWRVNRHRRPSKKLAFTEHHGRALPDPLPKHARKLVKVGVFTYSGEDLDQP